MTVFSIGDRIPEAPLLSSRLSVGQLGLLVSFGALCLLALGGLQQLHAFGLERKLESGGASVVSGKVDEVVGGTWALECFTVDGHKFGYDGPTSIGFRQSAYNGGPIRQGLPVRVSHIGETIVRLEIAEGANPAPPSSADSVGIPKGRALWGIVWPVGCSLLLLLVIWRYWLYYAALRRSQGRPPIQRNVREIARTFIEMNLLGANWLRREDDPHVESLRRWWILSSLLWVAIVVPVTIFVGV